MGTDESVIEAAIEFLRLSGQQRWFLYLHLMDLHEYIYDEESALFGSTYSDIYDNSIRWTDGVDRASARVASPSCGQLEKTLIVVASDHGEAFLERGFEGHAREVYRETTEVPFLLSFPFRLEPGVVVETRTQNVDVWPTILDLLGLEPPDGIDGRSLAARDPGERTRRSRPVDGRRHGDRATSTRPGGSGTASRWPTVAVVEDEFRYVRVPRATGGPPVEQLFDATRRPARAARSGRRAAGDARAAESGWRTLPEKKPPWGETPTREIDELELNLLRALGYKIQ